MEVLTKSHPAKKFYREIRTNCSAQQGCSKFCVGLISQIQIFINPAIQNGCSAAIARGSSSVTDVDSLGESISRRPSTYRRKAILTKCSTHFEYDKLGRLTAVVDALGQRTEYTYDEAGNKLSQTDANGHTTRWTYDAVGRELNRTLPEGQTERYQYGQETQWRGTDVSVRSEWQQNPHSDQQGR